WIAGLVELLRDRGGRGWRVLGITWLVIMACMLTMHGRMYYPAPAYPMLFAAGGLVFERWLAGMQSARWLKPAYITLLVVTGLMIAPFAYFPLLTVDQYIAYAKFWHFEPPRLETHRLGPLPQLYADQFGWEEMTATVARVYNSLPPEVRARTAIFGQNYGQAGAIDLFGPKYGLPPAISGHQSYFLWGPRGYSGDSMIVMAGRRARLEQLFTSVEKVARVEHPYSMPYNHFDVYYCQGLRQPLKEIWPQVKNWD